MKILKTIFFSLVFIFGYHNILVKTEEQSSSHHHEHKNTIPPDTNFTQSPTSNCTNKGVGQGSSCKMNFTTGHKCIECEAIDPVFDPAYNMKEIAKQSILLEEHLIQRNKRCRDCITKHFLHIIGLAEEAANMCSSSIANYPLLRESIILYNELFKEWLNVYKKGGIDNDSGCCSIAGRLRQQRKSLIEIYFYSDQFK